MQRSKVNKKQGKRLWFVIKDKVLYTYAASEVKSLLFVSTIAQCHVMIDLKGTDFMSI